MKKETMEPKVKKETMEPPMPKDNEGSSLVIFQQKARVAKLPQPLQEALAKYKLREQPGIAPQWKPEAVGAFLVGEVVSVRDEVETEYGPSIIVTFQTMDGAVAVFLGADLKVKLANAAPGQKYVIQYDGKMTKAENPKLKNDMKKYTVIEVLPD